MTDIAERIAEFESWHYDFELHGEHTNPGKASWQNNRAAQFLEPSIRYFGGTLEGKRVLDLGCNAGFFALRAAEAGAEYVLGVDGRQMHIDQANLVFEAKGIERDRYHFATANVLDFPYEEHGPFDLILNLGLLYHVNKPVTLFEVLEPVARDLHVIDTKLSVTRGSWFELRRDGLDQLLDAVDYELVMVPTAKAVLVLAEQFGYRTRVLVPYAPELPEMEKYRYGVFAAFVCSKVGDPPLDVFPSQSLAGLYKAQDRGLREASWANKGKARPQPAARRRRLPFLR